MGKSAICERLEPRRLLAARGTLYHLPDFQPDSNGLSWHLVGTRNGEEASVDIAITRTKSVITYNNQLTYPAGTSTSDERDLIGQSGPGSLVFHETSVSGNESVITYDAKPKEFPDDVKVGDVAPTFNLGITDTITSSDGTVSVLTGTLTESKKVVGYNVVTLADGRFVYALEVIVDATRKLSGTVKGKAFAATDHAVSDQWYAKNLGLVAMSASDDLESTVDGQDGPSNGTDSSYLLQSSPLLSTVTSDLNLDYVLMVHGTSGKDDIHLLDEGGETFVYTGGVGQRYGRSLIQSIQVLAGDGNDHIVLDEAKAAYVDAGAGNDTVIGSPGNDTLTGGAGKDSLDGAAGDDRLNGNAHNDLLIGGEGKDRLYGGDGNDLLQGGGGVDRIYAGAGDDLLDGGGSNDKLYGEAGNDILYGGTQNDLLNGGEGTDTFFGGDGNDTLYALDSTTDSLDGGPGNNTAQYDQGDNGDILTHI